MAIKEYKYRGFALEELKKMDEKQLRAVMPSHVRRKMDRGIKHDKKIMNAVDALKEGAIQRVPVKTHRRDILITPNMVGLKMAIYNGKTFGNLEIQPEMIGFHVGEFVETKKRPVHSKAGVGATKSSKNVGKK